MSIPNCILQWLLNQFEEQPDTSCLLYKPESEYLSLSWRELTGAAEHLAKLLQRLGVTPKDHVACVSENRMEWIVTDLAIQICSAVHVPIHATLTGQQIYEQVEHSGAKVLILSTGDQLDKMKGRLSALTAKPAAVTFESVPEKIDNHHVWQLDHSELEAAPGAMVRSAIAVARQEDVITILYTSGTTGEPKGVMLTQMNLLTNTASTLSGMDLKKEDMRLNFLPLSHIYARTCDYYTWLHAGHKLAIAQSRDTVVENCREVQPTLLNAVPYFYERLCRVLTDQGLAEKENSFNELLGGRLRMCNSGGAALADHVYDYVWAQGTPLLQGYGLSETSPVITYSTIENTRRSSAGQAIDGIEIKIADDGEILTRGPHVMLGYYKNETATNEIIRDGWFHTGDIGSLDGDGYLFITGRKKELIVTSGGKNVSPVLVESLLTSHPLISQAMVIGDDRKFLSALIVVNEEEIGKSVSGIPANQLNDNPQVRELLNQAIKESLADISHYEQVAKFHIIDTPFSIEAGEMTPKMSLRRPIITDRYQAQIEAMYE